jgi:hypothetical protein
MLEDADRLLMNEYAITVCGRANMSVKVSKTL